MHYGILVIVEPDVDSDDPNEAPSREEITDAVAEAMRRYRDSHWDWYQIGGRWTGHFNGYKPEQDPANLETCDLCGGTGDRATFRNEPRALQVPEGCNGCKGTGQKVKWPTAWAEHHGDVIKVAELTEKHLEVYAVLADGYWHGGDEYEPWRPEDGQVRRRPLPPLDYLKDAHRGSYAVIVDAHN